MTPEEQKREKLLKRILPAMGITIIYFIFISGMLSDDMEKAEKKHSGLVLRGVSTAAVPGVMRQQTQMRTQISTLTKQHYEYKQKLKDLAGFLSNTTPSNESSTQLASIMANNNIRVKNEQREAYAEENLSPALKEVWQWLKPTPDPKDKNQSSDIYVQHLSLSGSYQNMYAAMSAIAQGQLKAVPVSFSMQASTDDNATTDHLDWELLLWM